MAASVAREGCSAGCTHCQLKKLELLAHATLLRTTSELVTALTRTLHNLATKLVDRVNPPQNRSQWGALALLSYLLPSFHVRGKSTPQVKYTAHHCSDSCLSSPSRRFGAAPLHNCSTAMDGTQNLIFSMLMNVRDQDESEQDVTANPKRLTERRGKEGVPN